MPADTAFRNEGLDFIMTRTFDAPADIVYKCWTHPDFVVQWWGPHGFTASASMDVRAGGQFALTMRGSDDTDYPLQGEYLIVEENRRLVMEMHLDDHPASWHDYLAEQFTKAGGAEDTLPSLTLVTSVIFEGLGKTTRLTVTQSFKTVAERDAFTAMGNAEGWGQSYDKLDKLLAAH
jgi:uncharacterized protein YndB with AHSA1/START domain